MDTVFQRDHILLPTNGLSNELNEQFEKYSKKFLDYLGSYKGVLQCPSPTRSLGYARYPTFYQVIDSRHVVCRLTAVCTTEDRLVWGIEVRVRQRDFNDHIAYLIDMLDEILDLDLQRAAKVYRTYLDLRDDSVSG